VGEGEVKIIKEERRRGENPNLREKSQKTETSKIRGKGNIPFTLGYIFYVVKWFRDILGLISNAKDIKALTLEVAVNCSVYFISAFN